MNLLFKKPHLAFFFTIPVILLLGVFGGDSTLDINVHDTYFVIANPSVAMFIAVFFGMLGGGYWIIQTVGGKLSTWLSAIHIFITIGGILAAFSVPFFIFGSHSESSFPMYDEVALKNQILAFIIVIILFGQLLYLVHLVLAIVRKNR